MYKIFSEAISDTVYGQECSLEGTGLHIFSAQCTLDSEHLSTAERDPSGLCCPVELNGVLSDSFLAMDKEILRWLAGAIICSCSLFKYSQALQLNQSNTAACRDAGGRRAAFGLDRNSAASAAG